MLLNDITVVIKTFYSEKKIEHCLKSIGDKCRVIIVENSSNIELKNKLEKYYKNLNFVITEENLGYSKSNNLGIKMVNTKYALILNPDTYLSKEALENFLHAANKQNDFAILGPYIQTEKDEIKDTKTTEPISVKNIKGFAMFLNLEKIRKIGFFDENFFLYFEDIDLCRRAINNGYKIFLLPSVKISHIGSKSVNFLNDKELELNRNWHWMWSSYFYFKKYNGSFKSFLFFLPKLVSSLLKSLFFNMIGNKDKGRIYLFRFLGLFNSIKGKKSWYRPKTTLKN